MRWELRIADWSDTPAATGTFEIQWLFAATACGGGAFVTRLWVEAHDLHVDSAFDLNLRVVTGRPRNVGSAIEPIASLPAVLDGSLASPTADIAVHRRFEVRGDGSFRDTD